MYSRQKLLQALQTTEQDLEREDWSWEQFVDLLIPNLKRFSKTVKELADPKNMHRGTREVLEMYESTLWLTDEEVAARTHTNVPAAGARRRELRNEYGYTFETRTFGSVWQYRLVRDEKSPCV